MQVLITGGAGYIGSHTAAALIRDGYEVIVLDSLVKGHRELVPAAAVFIQGDVGDYNLLDQIFTNYNIDAVLHFAAFIEAGESMKHPERFFYNNTAKTITLLERMMAHGVNQFVFSSTAAVYGNPEYIPIDENHPKAPTNAYGASKLEIERILEWLCKLNGLAATSLRYFNASGASEERGEMHQPETHLIPLLLEVAAGKRDHLKLFGTTYPTPDGTCVRDYIHVEDLASAHILALKNLTPHAHQFFNLGNGSGFSNREVIDTTRSICNLNIKIVEVEPREGDPSVLVADAQKAKNILNWSPRFPTLHSIIESSYKWNLKSLKNTPDSVQTPDQK